MTSQYRDSDEEDDEEDMVRKLKKAKVGQIAERKAQPLRRTGMCTASFEKKNNSSLFKL